MNYIREAITQQHIGEEAIALRRHLHAHPDLSGRTNYELIISDDGIGM